MDLDSIFNDSFYIDNSAYYDYIETPSDPIPEKTPAVRLSYTVCCIVISCIAILGNSFLLWVLLKERAWKTTSKILPLQLTISNLCFAVTLSFEAQRVLRGWVFRDWGCAVHIGAFLLWLYSYVWILTAMTLYRYVAVVRALSTPKKICVIMASIVIWLVCAAVSISGSLNSEARDHGFGEIRCFRVPRSLTMIHFEINTEIGLFFVLPFIIMTFCYVHMCVTITQRRMISHHQASRLILGLIVVFFLCLAPYNIIWFIGYLMMLGFVGIPGQYVQNIHHVHAIIHILLYLHCCLNPLIHIIGTQRFRRHLPMSCKASSLRRDGSQNLSLMAVIPPHEASV